MINFALTGNPNVGKTSLFNRITHSLEHVGNWHGVTVDKKEKIIMYDHKEIKIIDLPGFYSLSVYSYEESISRNCILGGKNDMVISVCEVNNLARNLYLTLQLLELDVPVLLVINMMDELRKQGKVLNYRNIENILKIPIVPMSAKYHSDVHLLMDVALDHINHPANLVDLKYLSELPLNDVNAIISQNVAKAGLKPRYAAIKVLEKDPYVIKTLGLSGEQLEALQLFGDWQTKVAALRYAFIDEITKDAFRKAVIDEHHEMHEHSVHNVPIENELRGESEQDSKRYNGKRYAGELRHESDTLNHTGVTAKRSYLKHKRHHDNHSGDPQSVLRLSKFDRIALNKYLALPLFLMLMMLIFVVTFGLVGKWLSDGFEWLIERFIYTPTTGWLSNIGAAKWVTSLVGDGIINGVGGIIVFLPQITLLFLFLAFLEDSGYISRVAFMTDGIFRKIGLSGRSVFTMLMGFGCSATAVLTARGLEDDRMRKKTVLLTPFMSCSARLPVYIILINKFLSGNPLVIFALYIIGVAVAIMLAAVFEKIKRLKSGKLSFIMEIPPYRFPTFERVFQLIWHNVKTFLIRVGTVVFTLSVIVWLLSNFSFTKGFIGSSEELSDISIMAVFGRFIAPVFKPLGFGNWQAVTALLSGLVAKEVIISSITGLGGADMLFAGEFASLSAFCFLVFVLLYVPCIATIVAMNKEVGFKWTAFGFILQIGVAYVAALAARGIGLLFISYTAAAVTALIIAFIALIGFVTIRGFIKRKGRCSGCNGGSCGGCGGSCGK